MARRRADRSAIIAEPADREHWDDLLAVFGPQGCYMGCWCMYWRLKRKDFGHLGVKGRRRTMLDLTKRKTPPGILFYDTSGDEDVPFGWCSVGPREDYSVLARSPNLKPVDDLPTWSILCFFTTEEYRGKGLFRSMTSLAIDHAREHGAPRVEAYPQEGRRSGVNAYMGLKDVYLSLGFYEIARRKPERPVLRLELETSRR